VDAKEQGRWEVRVPPGSGARAAKSMPKLLEREPKLSRYQVRWGESLDDIAALRRTTRSSLQSLNGLRWGESVRPGALLFVPAPSGVGVAAAEHLLADGAPASSSRPIVVVPAQRFSYEGRRRVFYRVVAGDTLRDLATVLSVNVDEICRWNTLAPGATLHEGMTLQVFVPKGQRHEKVFLLDEAEARVLPVGSEDFFAHFEGLKGRKRIEIATREGDSFAKIASRYGLSLGMMERINHRSRRTPLSAGEKVVVYVPATRPDESSPVPAPVETSKEEEVAVADARAGREEAPAKADARGAGESAAPVEEGATRPAAMVTPVAEAEEARAEERGGDKGERAKDGGGAGAKAEEKGGGGSGEQRKAAAAGEEKAVVEGEKKPAAVSESEKTSAGDAEKKQPARPEQRREEPKPAGDRSKTAI
jgi:membrane-bound lytic murein transglycosylase D